MNKQWLAALAAALLVLAACAPAPASAPGTLAATAAPTSAPGTPAATASPTSAPAGGQQVRADKQRLTTPNVAPADLAALTSGNTTFAFDLYQALRKSPGNFFYSPHSISLALAMTYAGARGATAQQMANTLHFTLPPERLHPAFDSLDLALAQRGQGAKGQDAKGFRLNVVNAIWGQTGYQFQPDFLNLLAEDYGAGLRLLDFSKAPEPSRGIINQWVNDQTEGKIKDLIPQGAIDPLTRLVLTNAIYFNAAWSEQFNKNSTADGPFTALDNSKVTVPLMHQSAHFGYVEGASYQAVELPYDGQQLSMVVLLPAAGQFDGFEQALDGKQFDAILKVLAPKLVVLTLPRFKTEASFMLKDTLTALGMRDAFAASADFSGMTGKRDFTIGAVIHKAYVSVDENGTEAAAATAVSMPTGARPEAPVAFTADRPFIFLIRDIQTGAVLFVGRIVDASR
jgi:serpin B